MTNILNMRLYLRGWLKRVLIVLLASLTIPLSPQGQKKDFPFFVVQLSDPQFGFYTGNKDFTKETELYERAVAEINRLRPDLVFITGDFVNDMTSEAQWKEFNRITGLIDPSIMVRLTPGNHDIGDKPTEDEINEYNAIEGYDRFSFSYRNCRFIGINSCIIKGGSPDMEQEQLKWLEKELKQSAKDRQILIFCHYPFFIKSADEPESYSNIDPVKRKPYLELFAKYNVSAVFAGHLHNNSESSSGKTMMVVTSSLGKPLGDTGSGFRVIKIYNDRIESSFYSLDEIPVKIEFSPVQEVR